MNNVVYEFHFLLWVVVWLNILVLLIMKCRTVCWRCLQNLSWVVVGRHCPKGDYGVASTRCSIRHLYDVISKFDERKKQLVRSIGFRLIEGCQFG